ncbi:VTT domain-containing protein [Flavihumibacter rivuli]|uniref:DedA family protein n=1 Tax=Flavihumibacter rivuli TaxID=2838156 RepID=UPI001BDF7005|nr:VTT domain-containing protein [Flavihumibacter rivuli]ULQ56832.1 VTT domain-containing protein [Flavihumibacter rivuli]
MKQGLIAIIILLCGGLFSATVWAQGNKVRVINQYETPVKDFVLTQGGSSKALSTDKDGYVDLSVDTVQPFTITAEAHDTTSFKWQDVSAEKVVELHKNFTWKDLLNPMFYIVYGGLWLLLFIVFAETGLFAGFFLPGDSLLFVAGIYSTNLAHEFLESFGLGDLQNEWLDLLILVGLISVAGVIGNTVGYWFGRRIGPAMFKWKDNFFFKKRYLDEAHDFYDKHGGGAIVFARFLPIVRTFAPIIAGIVGMDKKKFAFYNISGCIAWVFSMIFAGHFLQIWVKNQFGFELKEHLEMIIILIVLVTTAPVIWKLVTGRNKAKS